MFYFVDQIAHTGQRSKDKRGLALFIPDGASFYVPMNKSTVELANQAVATINLKGSCVFYRKCVWDRKRPANARKPFCFV